MATDPKGALEFRLKPYQMDGKPHATEIIEDEAAFIKSRDDWRYAKTICGGEDPCPVSPTQFNLKQSVVELIGSSGGKYTMKSMDQDEIKSPKTVSNPPWSSAPWQLRQGLIASRYAAKDWPNSPSWETNKEYFKNNPPESHLGKGPESKVNELAPSEKWDLLIGDRNFTMTNALWNEGKSYIQANQSIEPWINLGFGWAAGSISLPTPKYPVILNSVDGIPITFYPDDIKALGSLFWAKTRYERAFIGHRCATSTPQKNQFGRIVDKKCPELNPGLFHLVLVNRLGQKGGGLILDASLDGDIWNRPISSYSYHYFNPKTLETANTLEDAEVTLPFASDQFKKFRNSNSKSVVGIALEIQFLDHQPPKQSKTPLANQSKLKIQYFYDVELDSKGRLIDGEWYTSNHPDFLWAPITAMSAKTWGDRYARGDWSGKGSPPTSWIKGAAYDARFGTPMGKIVRLLFDISQREARD
jgi:hypothetical protein